jgi:hypothetical protein
LAVRYKDSSKSYYQLNVKVEKKAVEIKDKILSRSPVYLKRFGAWFGAGANFIRTSQRNSTGSSIVFASFKLPTYYAKFKATFYKNWDALYTYKFATGATTSGDGITVNQGSFDWFTHTAELRWTPESWKAKIFKNTGQFSIRLGGQQHLVPYVVREAVDIANVEENGVTMVSIGGQYNEVIAKNWEFEVFMRYQQPISTGDKFNIESSFAFDGSLGLIYGYKSNWRWGLFWYGQQQGYDISSFDSVDQEQVTGQSNWFYSNAEIRAGFTF